MQGNECFGFASADKEQGDLVLKFLEDSLENFEKQAVKPMPSPDKI